MSAEPMVRGDVDVVADSPGDVNVTYEDYGDTTVFHLPLDVTPAQWDAAMKVLRRCLLDGVYPVTHVLRAVEDAIGETPSVLARRVQLRSVDEQIAARTAEFLPREGAV